MVNNFQDKANFIWTVADDILRGAFKAHEYGDVILPFVVLRRLDMVLEPHKDAVIQQYEQFKDVLNEEQLIPVLRKAAGDKNFYNHSFYDLRRLAQDAGNIELNFNNYLNGYSKNVRDIIENFKLEGTIATLVKNDLLFMLVDKFTEVDLSPANVSNHEMGYIFEELLRRFSEMSNETAGEHYTPREVIRLMVSLLLAEHKDELQGKGIIRTVYDPACGTGGMLIIAKDYIQRCHQPRCGSGDVRAGAQRPDLRHRQVGCADHGRGCREHPPGKQLHAGQVQGQAFQLTCSPILPLG